MRRFLPGPDDRDADATARSPDALDLDAAYALPTPRPGMPHVRSNFVTSIDGAIEIEGRSGELGGPADRRVFRLLRWLCDVVLVGAGTARTEDYGPVIVPAERREMRAAAGLAPVPPVAVITGTLDFNPGARLFTSGTTSGIRPIMLTSDTTPIERRQALSKVADIVICGETTVEPKAALTALAERGLLRVLTEGGPNLHAQLARDGLLDELCLTVAPTLAGPGHLGMMAGEPWRAPTDLRLGQVLEEDGVLFLRYHR